MSGGQRCRVPSRLDDITKFFYWDFDVAMLAMAGTAMGVIDDHLFVSTAIGVAMAFVYQKSKAGKHRGFGLHLIYWHTSISFGMKVTPPSSIREFIG